MSHVNRSAGDPIAKPLTMKLSCGVLLTYEDEADLALLQSGGRGVCADNDVIAEGDRPNDVHLVVEGLLCRYKALPNGRRHIMALLIPGDFCDLHVACLDEMDHGIMAVVPSRIVDISRPVIDDLLANPRIAQALRWSTLVDEAILREWLVNIGQREADKRFAHLLCEMHLRYETVGMSTDHCYQLPLTQQDLGAVLGLSSVHVNRTLQALRRAGLVAFRGKMVSIPDLARLKAFAGFNSNYLHRGRRSEVRYEDHRVQSRHQSVIEARHQPM